MFTHERVVFALCFLAAFIILLIWSYKTDKEERRDNFNISHLRKSPENSREKPHESFYSET